jgi:hypothetical protein
MLMSSVRLDFIPPQEQGIVKLEIWEAPVKDGTYTKIEDVTDVGSYPNYLTYYTTDNATAPNNWFRIRWEDAGGALSEFSEPVQGGTTSLVKTLVDRTLLRNPMLDERVVAQTAEFIIQVVMDTDNPYDPDLKPTPAQLEGMTFFCLGYSMMSSTASSSSAGESYTAGLISQKSETGTKASAGQPWDVFLDQAGILLGFSKSFIMQMKTDAQPGLTMGEITSYDQSRLLLAEIV